MQVASISKNTKSIVREGFYKATRELDSSVMLSRAVVDMCGCCVPWLIMANNSTERKEKARKFSFEYSLAWLSPFLTIPLTNRAAMKHVGKLTKNFWSNSHKAIHISNEFLKDTDSMMSELMRMGKDTKKNPIESLYYRLNPKKKYNSKINVDSLLESCGGDKEKLRQRLIKSKNAVFVSDCLFTAIAMGSFPFLNNEITKKSSGQTGFSAEMSMAEKEIVEKRAEKYEKTKKKRFLSFVGLVGASTAAMSLAGFTPLKSTNNNSKLVKTLKKHSKLFDYKKGIYMSRLPLAGVVLLSSLGFIMSARNKTEEKDLSIRNLVGYSVFFGGDLLTSSLLTNVSDRLFGTKLRKENNSNKRAINKVFPGVKPIEQVLKEVEEGKIPKVNKKVASGIFWTNMVLLMGAMGFAIPKAINKMIKNDVNKDVKAKTNTSNINVSAVPLKNIPQPPVVQKFSTMSDLQNSIPLTSILAISSGLIPHAQTTKQ